MIGSVRPLDCVPLAHHGCAERPHEDQELDGGGRPSPGKLPAPGAKQAGPALSVEQVRLASRMREAGESVSTIGATLKVSRSTLYRTVFADAEQNTTPAVTG